MDCTGEEWFFYPNEELISSATLLLLLGLNLLGAHWFARVSSIIAAVEQRVPKIVTESALPVLELRACRVTPFAAARGRLTLSRSALYFQPLLNSPADTQEIRHPWPTLHYCLPRRYISRSQAAPTNFLRGYELYFAR